MVMVSFKTVQQQSLGSAVEAALQKKIMSGELKAGEWLPAERDLAVQMGVSRSSLHQAILSLEYKGFVSIVPRKGTVVCDYRKHPTPQSLAAVMSYSSVELDRQIFGDMMDFRIWLETECARRACDNIYASTMEEMRGIAGALKESGEGLTELTFRFHYLLTQASGNSIFSMIFRGFEPVVKSLTEQRYRISKENIEKTAQQMNKLLDCIESRDADAAAEAVAELLRHGIGYLEERYK